MNKTYGGYTLDQLKQIIGYFFIVRGEKLDFVDSIHKNKEHIFSDTFVNPHWSPFYELPLNLHSIIMQALSGLTEYNKKILEADNPQQIFIDETNKLLDEEGSSLKPDISNISLVLSALISLTYSMESMYLWGKSLNSLLDDVLSGDMEAFYKMLQVDRSCISIPALSHIIGKNQLLDDKDFFKQITQSMNKKVKDRRDDMSELRFALYALQEKGVIDNLSEDERYQLLVKELRLYRDGPEASRSLNTYIIRWKKESETDFSKSLSDTFPQQIHIVFCHVNNNSRRVETWRQKDTDNLLIKLGLAKKTN